MEYRVKLWRSFVPAASAFSLAVGMYCLGVPQNVAAQPRGSERAVVTQTVNGTAITLDFGRPVARGRGNLFGGVVHWGEVWTPGANWATTLEVDKPIRLDGHPVAPGKYSVWLRPSEEGPWRLSLNREWRLYHDSPVPDDDFVLHFDVSPEQGQHMEALNWYVHAIDSRRATLRVHWGPTFVSLDIETEEYSWNPLPADERASYLGSYAFDTLDPTVGSPMAVTIGVLEEKGRLVGTWGSVPIALVPSGPAEFRIGFMRAGALFDVADEMALRILTEDGVSTAAELRWEGRVFGVAGKGR
jgi:hypothetical protein